MKHDLCPHQSGFGFSRTIETHLMRLKPQPLFFLLALAPLLHAAEHSIKPGDNPQSVMDRAAPGDKLVFLPGLHQHRPHEASRHPLRGQSDPH
jgi:hypothetical protein